MLETDKVQIMDKVTSGLAAIRQAMYEILTALPVTAPPAPPPPPVQQEIFLDFLPIYFNRNDLVPLKGGTGKTTVFSPSRIDMEFTSDESYMGFRETVDILDEGYFASTLCFHEDFDFPQKLKVFRLQSMNEKTGKNNWDLLVQIASSKDRVRGQNLPLSITVGRNEGNTWAEIPLKDWGITLQELRALPVQYHFKLNSAQGVADGVFELWIGPLRVLYLDKVDMTGKGVHNRHITHITWGGWNSNSANKNTMTAPSTPAKWSICRPYRATTGKLPIFMYLEEH